MWKQLGPASTLPLFGLAISVGAISAAEVAIVVPNALADTDGDWVIKDLIPDYRLQMIVASDQFSELPEGANLLTHLAYRVDGSVNSAHTYTADRMTLRLSTTSQPVSELSHEFALNIGADEAVVFDDVVSWSTDGAGLDGGPKGYDFGLPVDPPFPYDPSQGNLLVDLTVLGGSSPLLIDFNLSLRDATRFVSSGENGVDSDMAEANTVWGGDILELRFQAVPEPSSFLFAGLGALALVVSARPRRVRSQPAT